MELSFGQLIDSIQEGQTAECIEGNMSNITYLDGKLVWEFDRNPVYVEEFMRKCRYRIVPSYINLDEAFTLLDQGQAVLFESNGSITTMQPNTVIGKTTSELLKGKWIRL